MVSQAVRSSQFLAVGLVDSVVQTSVRETPGFESSVSGPEVIAASEVSAVNSEGFVVDSSHFHR